MIKNCLTLILILLLSFTILAQNGDSPTQKWRIKAGIIRTLPDGELQLDRGSRKVVSIDVEGDIGYQVGLEYLIGKKTGLELNVAQSRMEYIDHEAFASGEILESSDQLNFTMISAAFNYHLLGRGRLDPYMTMMLGFVSYGSDFQITTELPGPALGPDPSPELVTFDLHSGASLGLGTGLDYEIRNGWMVGLKAQLNLSNLEASIVNDPEDDGRDIDLSVNPIILGFNLVKTF